MKAYYQHAGITIYHGDCREILPQVFGDVIVTDPPYGTGWVRGGGDVGEFHAKHERPDWDVFSVDWINPSYGRTWAVFCPKNRASEVGECFDKSGILFYRKTNPRPNGPDVEAIVTNFVPWAADRLEFSAYNGDSPLHPCQKPLELMEWVICEVSTPYDLIVDPFMGSGSTPQAAKKTGRKAIGIEIEEKYCEIAAKRLSQEVLAFGETSHEQTDGGTGPVQDMLMRRDA